jgi:hypothetical protein
VDQNRAVTPERKESFTKKLTTYLKLAADVASIVMDLRDSPSRKDWFSVGLRTANVGLTWYTGRKNVGPRSVWDFFNDDGRGWATFPRELKMAVTHSAKDLVVAPEYLDADVKHPFACLGSLDNEVVGWVVDNGQVTDGPYYREDREEATFSALSRLIWKNLGGRYLLYAPDGLVIDTLSKEPIVPTPKMDELLDRVKKFLHANESRGYLLTGAPGTGKSQTIQWLIRVLNMTSLRIDLGVLGGEADRRGDSMSASLETMLRVLRPDVLVLDDLDRIEVSASMLALLERARASCKVVIASANSPSALSGAATRPGRFDDIIHFEKLDIEVIRKILGEHKSMASKVEHLPAAYVAEFERRCRVLGKAQALKDLPELTQRAEETSLDSDG